MSRQQKRAELRQLNKNARMINHFTEPQLALVEEIIQRGTQQRTEQRVEEIISTIDRCMTAYFYLRFEDMTSKEIAKEQDILSSLLDDDSRKIELLLNECGGNQIMAKKKLEKYESDVRKVSNELLDNGVKQSEAIVILQDKFPALSKTMLVNKFKEVKAEREVKEVDPDVVAAAEYIFPEIKEEKKDKPEPQKQATEEKKEVTKVNAPKEVKTHVQAKSKLKRIGVLFQGEYGGYVKTPEGVTAADKLYKDVESVDIESKDIIEKNVALVESYQSSIAELNNKINECNLTMSNVKAMACEIKEVMRRI